MPYYFHTHFNITLESTGIGPSAVSAYVYQRGMKGPCHQIVIGGFGMVFGDCLDSVFLHHFGFLGAQRFFEQIKPNHCCVNINVSNGNMSNLMTISGE